MPTPRETDDAGCEAVPADLVELHEVLEWQAAVDKLEADESARGVTEAGRAPEDSAPESDDALGDDDAEPDITDTQTGQGVE